MKLLGKVRKDGKFWIGELPDLEIITQFLKKAEAIDYLFDVVELHSSTISEEFSFSLEWENEKSGIVSLKTDDTKSLAALILKRKRSVTGLSLNQLAKLMKAKSHNSVAAYENGSREPTLGKFQELMDLLGYDVTVEIKKKASA